MCTRIVVSERALGISDPNFAPPAKSRESEPISRTFSDLPGPSAGRGPGPRVFGGRAGAPGGAGAGQGHGVPGDLAGRVLKAEPPPRRWLYVIRDRLAPGAAVKVPLPPLRPGRSVLRPCRSCVLPRGPM